MKKDQYISYLINILNVWVISVVFGTEHRRLISFYDTQTVAAALVNEAVSGPLKENYVTLMTCFEGSEDEAVADSLISRIHVPIYILRLGHNRTTGNNFDSDISSHEIEEENYDNTVTSGMSAYNYLMAPSMLVIVINEEREDWWPLRNPDSNWATTTILIVSISSCWLPYLQTPLIEKASFVAMICPYASRGMTSEAAKYKVLTWLPFALGQKLVYLGKWNPDYFEDRNKVFIDRFQDMSEKNISTFAIDQDEPLVYVHDGKVAGVTVNILDSISKWLKFQNLLDHGVGNGWDELGEMVKAGKRDILINFSTFTPDRYREFDLSVAYHHEGFGVVLEVPKPFPKWQNIFYPFSIEVWMGISISLFVIIILYHRLNYKHEPSFVANAMSISQSLLSSPLATVPESWKTRNFLLIWWMASWILELSWLCNLIAVLTMPVFPTKIQTKQELAKSYVCWIMENS